MAEPLRHKSPDEEIARWRARRIEVEKVSDRNIGSEAAGALSEQSALERIIGSDDLVTIDFFDKMREASKAVCLIVFPEGTGTGALITPRLIITNNHVIPTADAARQAFARFGVDRITDPGVQVRLDPDAFFITDLETALDYTLVAIHADDVAKIPAGTSPLRLAPQIPPQLALGEPVSIIQHPGGRPKAYAVRDNEVIDVQESFITYETDTNPGSSGAPVFDWQWRMIGLHHSGVGPKDADGDILDRTGKKWDRRDDHDVAWYANEGVRIDAILFDLAGDVAGAPPRGRRSTPRSPRRRASFTAARRTRDSRPPTRRKGPATPRPRRPGCPPDRRARRRRRSPPRATAAPCR